jgi:hypothetical protein
MGVTIWLESSDISGKILKFKFEIKKKTKNLKKLKKSLNFFLQKYGHPKVRKINEKIK